MQNIDLQTASTLNSDAYDVDESISGEEAEKKYLTFYVDGQLYAIPSSTVIDIISMQTITYMPKLPSFLKGVINLRGKIVPLLDLRLKFGKEKREYDQATCIVVTETQEYVAGFIVDRVKDVIDVLESTVNKPSNFADAGTDCIAGVAQTGAGTALFLDISMLLDYGADAATGI